MVAESRTSAEPAVLAHRYRLDEVLGEGAMGTVYRAVDRISGAAVAVKILHSKLAVDPRMVARFDREIDAGRRFAHPNLVAVLDAGDAAPHGRYLVMPLLAGSDLRHEIAGGLGLRRTVALVDQLLAALEHVHGLGLVHRDVKPENLRLICDGAGRERLFLFDFGLVKPTGAKLGERRLTECGRVFGTPWYMAPEQAQGARIDRRVDLYAVGAVMFEMLTGAPPFEGSLAEVLSQQIQAAPPALPGWVPSAVARWVATMLAKDPAARPATAALAAAGLRAAVAGLATGPTVVEVARLGEVRDLPRAPVSMLRASRRQGRVLAAAFVIATATAALLGFSRETEVHAPVATHEPAIAALVASTPPRPAPSVAVPAAVAPLVAVVVDPLVSELEPPAPARTSATTDPPPPPPPRTRAPSRPRTRLAKPPVVDPPRRLSPSKPSRTAAKLPGKTASVGVVRDANGKIHLHPRAG